MAKHPRLSADNDVSVNDDVDEYGGDFSEGEIEIINDLFAKLPVSAASPETPIVSIERHEELVGPYKLGKQNRAKTRETEIPGPQWTSSRNQPRVPIVVDNDNRAQSSIRSPIIDENDYASHTASHHSASKVSESTASTDYDSRSPLARFRSGRRKDLSVTDLISPAWCEMQFWFSLTTHGRVKRTAPMKAGSSVHKALEEQVHRTVAVPVRTKEDSWGLRLWNMIQGLQTLRQTGMTRELEVWGLIDGQTVIGVIDELSYICPDRDLEAESLTASKSTTPLPPDQNPITDYLRQPGGRSFQEEISRKHQRARGNHSKIYLTDVKTRAGGTLPRGAARFRPTLLQLMLYRRLLSELASGDLDPSMLFSTHSLDQDALFSDAFVAKIAGLNEVFYDANSSDSGASIDSTVAMTDESDLEGGAEGRNAQGTLDSLLAHNSLRQLWGVLQSEVSRTFPFGAESVGQVLKVEYRTIGSKSDGADGSGQIIGVKTFLSDLRVLNPYIKDELAWWRGERAARGVGDEESFKCGYCEFAEGCDWRKEKDEEMKRRVAMRKEGSAGQKSKV